MGNSPAHAYIYEHAGADARRGRAARVGAASPAHVDGAERRAGGRLYGGDGGEAYGEAGRALARRVLVGQHPQAHVRLPAGRGGAGPGHRR